LGENVKKRSQRRATAQRIVIPEWPGTNIKGRETRELILRTALTVIVDEGFDAMSMRRIAAKCGIEFGNLTYHYPSREALVTELLDSVFRAYDQLSQEIQQHRHLSPEERLAEICQWTGAEVGIKQTAYLLTELWALANHDPFVTDRLAALYRNSAQPIVEIVEELRPDLPPNAALALGLYIGTSLDAMIIAAGYRKPYASWAPAFARMAAKSHVELVRTITVAEIGELPPIRKIPGR
jgi:AcrR family transcriptional regulator